MRTAKNPTLAEVGEKAAINVITSHAPSAFNGDDAAVLLHPAPNTRTVVSTDLLVQERHFKLDWSTPAEIGRKAITQNFADIEAMGARPIAALLGLSAPSYTRLDFVSELAKGIAQRVADYGAELVGGDITDGESIVISITAIGKLGGSIPALTLDRAKPGQIVVATGEIGASAAGLALLARYGRDGVPPEFLPLVHAHCQTNKPEGRGFVARSAGVTAMTDNSDGLITDLSTMAQRSSVSINLEPQLIAPTPLMLKAAEALEADPWEWVLAGGEDHTLMGTTHGQPPTGFRKIGTVGKHNPTRPVTLDHQSPKYTRGWDSY